MSTLPPYSTYRTDNKQQMLYPQQLSHGNVLTFTPPGFNQTLNVKFPDCRLAVCEKCKKNYKTRDMCRVRNSHTAEPWSTAFICFTLDDKCTDADGKYVDRPLAVRMIQWQPYCVKQPFDPKTPVCSACKKTNRTRSFCRERHKHRQLPWCTVYVLLSPADSIDPSTRVAPESIPKSSDGIKPEPEKTNDSEDKPADTEGAKKESLAESKDEITSEENGKSSKKSGHGDSDDGDDIHDIAESRTFLAKVSCHASSIHWLELAEFDATDSAAVHGGVVAPEGHMPRSGVPMQPMDPSQYYAQSMGGYAAQQHQFNLKSHQQYFFQMQQRHQQQYAAQQAAWQAQYNQQSSMPGQQPAPAQGAPVSVSVTAGEAAAQQSKQNSDTSGSGATQQQQGQHAQWMYHQQMYQNQIAQFQQAGGVIPQQSQQSAPEQPVDYSQQGHPSPDDIEPAPVHDDEHDGGENEAKRARFV